ncbi:hypothetical protein MtrunA17_Chr3g0129091 [Medicago truncatula]|uniref:Transmembrane protein, putative n=1 Tax=Medicago truncatula TaxID=3880 RepID=G7JA87_MEDTR|nr:transmembrane protein, putative [Medicago truncatula]RHN69837.1 hypothetical protein MtrunA17_Chr3g0129091 [Medicago truncatula]
MRLSKPTLILFVFFIFTVTCVVQMEAVINERVVDAGSGSSSVNVVRRGECEKQGVECKQVNGGNEDNDLESEDYIYTNSVLP